jgi:glutamine amidotransferase PdxT
MDGLIVPRGESTTLLTLSRAWDFGPAIQAFHAAGRPLFIAN